MMSETAIMVPPLWCDPDRLSRGSVLKVYETCQLAVSTRCINTNAIKAMAAAEGRAVRKVNTLKGYTNWSECVNGDWHMFRMPLRRTYAALIDAYDASKKHFRLPKRPPFGPVEYKGPCVARNDPLEVIRARKEKYNTRVADGEVEPRSKFRKPQLPYIEAFSRTGPT
jgi:hypothetical protein